MCIRITRGQSLDDWVFAFVHSFRFEYNKVSEQERRILEPFLKEQTLIRPCQAEILQFTNPHYVVLVFFFDATKQDLLINTYKLKWRGLDSTVSMLVNKYANLTIRRKDLLRLISQCRDNKPDALYSIDFVKNICCICFPRDPRNKGTVFPWSFNYVNDPQDLAEIVFNLNLCQASTYF